MAATTFSRPSERAPAPDCVPATAPLPARVAQATPAGTSERLLSPSMRIATWNVNSVNRRVELLERWLAENEQTDPVPHRER